MGFLMTFPQQQPPDREALRERFRKVIIMAGYKGEAPDKILAEYFDTYMEDVPKFIKMLEEYETEYRKEGEIL
jgi:hypothetical protein